MYRSFNFGAQVLKRARGNYQAQLRIAFGLPVVRPAVYFQVAALATAGSAAGATDLQLAGQAATAPVALEGEGEDDETRFKGGAGVDRGPRPLDKDRDRGPEAAAAAAAAAAGAAEGGAAAGAPPPAAPAPPAADAAAAEAAAAPAQEAPEPFYDVDFSSDEEGGRRGRGGGAGSGSDSDEDEELRAGQALVRGGARAVKSALTANLNDEPYEGPLHAALAGRRGSAARGLLRSSRPRAAQPASGTPDLGLAALFPLADNPARELAPASPAERARAPSFGAPRPASEAERKEAVTRAVLARRALRAVYSPAELEEAAAAAVLLHGSDMEGFPATPGHDTNNVMAARRATDYRPGEDPLMNAALPFNPMAVTVSSNMSWNAAPGSLNIDLKATLVARVSALGLEPAALPYLRLIAGPRYHAGKDVLRFSSQTHASATANKRQVMERLVALIHASQALLKKHGPMAKLPAFPAYHPGRTAKFFL